MKQIRARGATGQARALPATIRRRRPVPRVPHVRPAAVQSHQPAAAHQRLGARAHRCRPRRDRQSHPGLDAFTFDYAVEWPLFSCSPSTRSPSTSSSSATSSTAYVGAAAIGLLSQQGQAARRHRRRPLRLLSPATHAPLPLQYPALHAFRGARPNWHAAATAARIALDAILTHHAEFLDSLLRSACCATRSSSCWPSCSRSASSSPTRRASWPTSRASAWLPPSAEALRTTSSATISATIGDCRYHQNVVKLAAKFDEELKRLLDELRAGTPPVELAHAPLDFNHWTSSHASLGPAASIATAGRVVERSLQQAPARSRSWRGQDQNRRQCQH